MSATDVSPTRLEAARGAAKNFVDKVPDQLRVGLVSFSDTAQTLQTPTSDHEAVGRAIDQHHAGPSSKHMPRAFEADAGRRARHGSDLTFKRLIHIGTPLWG